MPIRGWQVVVEINLEEPLSPSSSSFPPSRFSTPLRLLPFSCSPRIARSFMSARKVNKVWAPFCAYPGRGGSPV